ncbi:MAG: septum formation protein Maf [Candidatus Methanomethylicota archaeon]|uniref:dTTP/UTP pyrophosphatase n=1 Tax=Thermoproteota archaeon TaxID=2056631 RepID=A0A497F8P2_9CREN|nr:MAG: septum formation protein Maf [Candidatus Verstraetearchaeota archaeon]
MPRSAITFTVVDKLNSRIILASASPRRREILERILGRSIQVVIPEVDEVVDINLSPAEQAKALALKKAEYAARKIESGIVVAGDTVVVVDGEVLGKPKDEREAREMLTKLSGKEHKVITGIAVINVETGEELVDAVETKVYMKKMTMEELELYIKSGEPLGKAGGYAIQEIGALLVGGIDGCFFNVVGLPISKLYEMLKQFGVNLLEEAVRGRRT